MKDIGIPEFGSPEYFFDLHDILKQHVEHDSARELQIVQVDNMTPG
jgi:hypothetical protein